MEENFETLEGEKRENWGIFGEGGRRENGDLKFR